MTLAFGWKTKKLRKQVKVSCHERKEGEAQNDTIGNNWKEKLEEESQPVSRVLSRMTIHLGRMSPCASSDLPGDRADHAWPFSLPPYLVLLRAGFTLPPLLPGARCALTAPFHPCLLLRTSAVCFLWHFPWACAPQALPGALSIGARTFLRGDATAAIRLTLGA